MEETIVKRLFHRGVPMYALYAEECDSIKQLKYWWQTTNIHCYYYHQVSGKICIMYIAKTILFHTVPTVNFVVGRVARNTLQIC